MPRRGKIQGNRGRGKGRRNNNIGGTSRVPFHTLVTTTLSGVTGVNAAPVNPQSSLMGGLSEIADQFDLFKIGSLEYRIFPMDPTYTDNQVLAFYPDVDIQVQTVLQASQSPVAAVQTPFNGVPSAWIRVPRSQLKGMLDWYKCTADAGAAEFESQGTVQAVGGLGNTMTYEIRGVCVFKNPVSSALMMERTLKRAEKAGLIVRLPPKPAATPS